MISISHNGGMQRVSLVTTATDAIRWHPLLDPRGRAIPAWVSRSRSLSPSSTEHLCCFRRSLPRIKSVVRISATSTLTGNRLDPSSNSTSASPTSLRGDPCASTRLRRRCSGASRFCSVLSLLHTFLDRMVETAPVSTKQLAGTPFTCTSRAQSALVSKVDATGTVGSSPTVTRASCSPPTARLTASGVSRFPGSVSSLDNSGRYGLPPCNSSR